MLQHPVESLLKPGDILFTSIPNFLYRRVARTTGSLTSHVGIAFYDQNTGWLVAESAVPTVRYVTLANFISRSDNGWLVVRRMGNGLSSNEIESLRRECDSEWVNFTILVSIFYLRASSAPSLSTKAI